MNREYVVVEWPDVQALMLEEDFDENSHLINDEVGVDVYGSSAYMVDKEWLQKFNERHLDIKTAGIPNVNFSCTDEQSDNEVRRYQRIANGFDESETWDLGWTIARFVHPRIAEFRKRCIRCGLHPAKVTLEEWNNILATIEEAFHLLATIDDVLDRTISEEEKIREGLKLFAEYYDALWW